MVSESQTDRLSSPNKRIMVAVMAVLMVGGEHSTEDDSTQDPLGLRSLNPVSECCLSNGQDNFVLDTILALIDEYICADLSSRPNFPLAVARRTIRCRK
jgi:hypothetical protein